jgi:hypothetical protein
LSLTQLEFFVDENFETAMKNCQEMWALYFSKTLKKSGVRTITGDMQESGNNPLCEFHVTSKILGSVQQRKLIRACCSERHFSGYVSLPKNFRTTPAAIFAAPIDIEKLIKTEGLILVKLARRAIQNQNGCCTFQ